MGDLAACPSPCEYRSSRRTTRDPNCVCEYTHLPPGEATGKTDRERGRQGDRETRREADKETGGQGDTQCKAQDPRPRDLKVARAKPISDAIAILRVIRPLPPFSSTSQTSRGKDPVYAPGAISRKISPEACPELAEGALEQGRARELA